MVCLAFCAGVALVLPAHGLALIHALAVDCSPSLYPCPGICYHSNFASICSAYSILRRCLACTQSTYLTPKSSMHKMKEISHVACLHSPGVVGLCKYPCLFKHCSSKFCTKTPACGNTYIPICTLMYTFPFSCTMLDKLYSLPNLF